MARSSMALASAAVPNCWASANAAPHNSAAAAIAKASTVFLMAFSLSDGPLYKSCKVRSDNNRNLGNCPAPVNARSVSALQQTVRIGPSQRVQETLTIQAGSEGIRGIEGNHSPARGKRR